MTLAHVSTKILDQLFDVVEQIGDEDFVRPSYSLAQASVGQHFRHTIEFFLCLEEGFSSGKVNYDNRAHDCNLETSRKATMKVIESVKQFVNSNHENRDMELEVNYSVFNGEGFNVKSTYFRELIYNIEHAVHHMALIKIGLSEIVPDVSLPADFGISNSTIRYRQMHSLT